MPATALLWLRMLVTVAAVAVAWRFGVEGALVVLALVVAFLIAIKARRMRRDLD